MCVANRLIYEKIEKKGIADAEEILRLGRNRAQAMEEEAINEAQKEVDEILSKSDVRNRDRLKTELIKKEQAMKQRSLHHKKMMIDKVFERVLEKLKNLEDKALFTWVEAMIKREAIEGNEELLVAKSDYQRYRKVLSGNNDDKHRTLDRLNQQLGKHYQLMLSLETVDIDGGFFLRGKKFDIDCSFKTLLDAKKEAMETEIAHRLFEEEKA